MQKTLTAGLTRALGNAGAEGDAAVVANLTPRGQRGGLCNGSCTQVRAWRLVATTQRSAPYLAPRCGTKARTWARRSSGGAITTRLHPSLITHRLPKTPPPNCNPKSALLHNSLTLPVCAQFFASLGPLLPA